MKIYIFILKFLFVGALFIISNQNLYLTHQEDLSRFSELYYSWLNNIFSNVVSLTAYVVKFEWLPVVNESAKETERIDVGYG